MEFRHLQSFTAATEQQSFTKAAKAVSLTQAAISQHVAALERELGVSLFRRTGRSVVSTETGRRFYAYARKVLELLDEARRDVGHVSEGVSGTLRIATCTIAPESFLPALLAKFRQRYPRVSETIDVSDSTQAARAVEQSAADIGIVGELPRTSQLESRAISAYELVLVAAPNHPLARRKIVPQQLIDQRFVVREPDSGCRHGVELALREMGISPTELNVAMEMNSNEAIRAAVEQGAGIAFLSNTSVQRDLAEGRLATIPLEGFQAHRDLYLITDPRRLPSPAVRVFLDFLQQWQGRSQGLSA